MKKPPTPFPATGYFGPAYFCDRKEELDQFMRNIRGGNSTTLTALRRLGKTALIHHLFHQLRSDYITIYMDILPTESLGDMLDRFSTAMASQYSERSKPGRSMWRMIKSLRPVISYDPLSGTPQVTIRSAPDESRKTMTELFQVLEMQPKPVVIAIDEFQQILEYPEKQTEAWLRSVMQKLRNTTFIFSGSQQHLMKDMFTNPEKPFFRSTQFMKIGKLKEEIYHDFIVKQFRKHSRSISHETVTEMLRWTDLHTYYVQLLCNRVFLTPDKEITTATWKEEAARILREQEFVFYGYREMLTKSQWDLLKAIAMEGRVYQPTSADFISRYALGNPSSVLRSLHSLQKMELVYRENDGEGRSYYGIYDVLFGRWVAR